MLRFISAFILLLFIPCVSISQDSGDKKFEGYSKFTKLHAHYEINADATYVESVDYAIKVLDKEGIDRVNTQSVSYSNTLNDMQVVSAYTLKKDGKRIDVPKNNFQVQTNSGENGADPIISDIKTKTVIFPDVSIGDSIVFSYKLIQKEALFPKQFSAEEVYSNAYICEDCSLSVSAPASLPIRVETREIKGGALPDKNGKHQWSWNLDNRDIAKQEQITVNEFDYGPRVVISTFKDYAELAAAYDARAKPKSAVTERIRKLANEIAGDTKGDHDIAKALYDWVSKNIHYAGNCIGIGSVVPHDTDHILDNKIGDCKDHTALLQALLAAKGIESSPALINSGNTYTVPDLPTVGVFDHVINYIPSLHLYADSTSETTPFGMLPMPEEGKPVILTSHFTAIEHTPATDATRSHGTTSADITFHEDGSADGLIKTSGSGVYAITQKAFFQRLDMTKFKDRVVQAALSAGGLKGTGEFTRYDDPKGQEDPFTYDLKFHADNAINLPGPGAIFITSMIAYNTVSISQYITPSNIERPKHEFACAGGAATIEVTFHLPKGTEILAIPKDVHLKNKYATYDATYKQTDGTVTTSRAIVDNTPGNTCGPDVYDEFKPFYDSITKDLKAQLIYR